MAPQKKSSGKRTILLRYGVVIALILLFASKIASNIINTAVIDAECWKAKADSILAHTQVINPERGNILAADGSVLATNLNFYTLRIDYRTEQFQDDSLRKYIGPLSEALARDFPPRTAAEWQKMLLQPLKTAKEKRPRSFRLLTNLSHADVERVKKYPFFCKGRARTGLHQETQRRRTNPYGEMARRSVGKVGQTWQCNEIHGISGLEKALDTLLYGVPGETEKRALTHGIVNWAKKEPVNGYDIVTTIDIGMQDIVENELNSILQYVDAEWGVAVLMEVSTGDIKAISNLEKSPDGSGYIEAMNRAVLGYEPGSVIKTLSMLIALEEGIVTDLDQEIVTGSSFNYIGRPLKDSHYTSSVTVKEILEQSSNIATAKLITGRYGRHPGEFYSKVKSLGFLEPMHTGIAGELTPRFDSVPDTNGGRLTLSRQCFGYATEVPPMYTLALYNAIANDGVFVRPRLVQRLINRQLGIDSVLPVTNIRDRICTPENARTLRGLLKRVVWGEHGTARILRNPHVEIAGKTGTSYTIEDGAYNTSRKRLTFCGFFPAENPKYSCIVLTYRPRANWFGAPTTSGQVVRNIALRLYSRGLLGDSTDYHRETPPVDGPVLLAGTDASRSEGLVQALEMQGKVHALKARPSRGRNVVPDVTGMDLRSAVNVVESAGYNVSLSGTGRVVSLSPSPGTPLKRGARVSLTLR